MKWPVKKVYSLSYTNIGSEFRPIYLKIGLFVVNKDLLIQQIKYQRVKTNSTQKQKLPLDAT